MQTRNNTSRILLALVGICLFSFLSGCIESIFHLSSESRLPRWATVPGYSRADLNVEIIFYTYDTAEILVYGPHHQLLKQCIGSVRWHPVMKQNRNIHSSYEIVTVAKQSEIFEQKKLDNVLYVSDDPELVKGIGVPAEGAVDRVNAIARLFFNFSMTGCRR